MLAWLNKDGRLLMAGRGVRAFSYGFMTVMLGVYLGLLGLSPFAVGAVLTATLVGDAALTLLVTLWAERFGRRKALVLLSLSTALAALLFLWAPVFGVLLIAPLVGVIASGGKDAGPFNVLGQAMLPQACPPGKRTAVFALDQVVGEGALALGSLASGLPALFLPEDALIAGYRALFVAYAVLSLATGALYLLLSPSTEPPQRPQQARKALLPESRGKVLKLAGLFAVDAAGGGLILQSFLAYWFFQRFGLSPQGLGLLFAVAGLLTAASAFASTWLAQRIGLLNTMVFTHIPSNVIIMLIPFAPGAWLAIGLFLVRTFLSQMDVPTRQSYTMAIVAPEERVAAAGITNLTRFSARAIGPGVGGFLFQSVSAAAPLFLGGAIKIAYDLALFAWFRNVHPPEEAVARAARRA